LEGESLVDAIRNDFTPAQLLNDTQVKDTLYARVFIEQDSVRCIYSGLSRFLPSGVDPSQWLFGEGSEVGSINLEHGWPQAKGAGEGTNGHMNMHHLYPSRSAINTDRSNFPFGEIPDAQSQKWYYKDVVVNSIPISNIDAYSEFKAGEFEPRESVKGDIARAMFYFWTIYREDALAADPLFFDQQRHDLCQWHEQDPVDDFERIRNERIAVYQEGKQNPFLLDCSLARRTYCAELVECETVGVSAKVLDKLSLKYIPSSGQFYLQGKSGDGWWLRIIDLLGRPLYTDRIMQGEMSASVYLVPGFYIAYAIQGNRVLSLPVYMP
jgi:endonuclease I